MNADRVSVLIPCFNNAAFVEEAIDSALAQTHPAVEVVVVDDGSTDDSWEVIRRYGDRIIAARQENAGACAARNHALKLSRGSWIQYLDADDRLQPGKVARQLRELEENGVDACFCLGNLFGDGQPLRAKKSPVPSPDGTDPFVYFCGRGLSTPSPLLRRQLVERVGGFREGVPRAQERDFHLRLAAANARISLIREHLYDVRHDGRAGRITRSAAPPAYLLELLLQIKEIVFSGPPYEMTEQRSTALAGWIFQQAMYAYRQGRHDLARRGFRAAYEAAPRFAYQERAWYKWGAQLAGPMAMERLLAAARGCRTFFGRSGQAEGSPAEPAGGEVETR